jgi:hypothetical protein
MSAAFAKLLTFGVLLILAAGLLMAGTSVAAAHTAPQLYADGPSYHVTAKPAAAVDKVCATTLARVDCSTCCHDMGSSGCCGHVAAFCIEPCAATFSDDRSSTGTSIPVAAHGAQPQTPKRPPRLNT